MSDSLLNLNKFEQKNIEINREDMLEKSTTVHNLEDFLQQDDAQIQSHNAYISRLKVNLKALYDGEHESLTLERVKETVSELTGMMGTEVGYISKLMDAANSLDAFIDTHQGTYFLPYKKRRKMLVNELKKVVQEMLLSQQQKMESDSDYIEPQNIKRRNAIKITKADMKQAESGVEELAKYITKWKERMGEYIISTPEEMIKAKLALFEPYLEDINTYRLAKNKSEACKKLIEEYDSLRLRANLINWDKSKEGRAEFYKNKSMDMAKEVAQDIDSDLVDKKAMDKEYDKGLTKEQAAGIQSIDRWMIRNFSNGGLVGQFGITRFDNAQESFVQKILSLSKRERLYLYYMVETKARKTATASDMVKSQLYVPNLSEFKNQMLATKFKITKHLTGGYVYWHKLTEAMQRLNGQGKLLESFLRGKKELSGEEDENSQIIKELEKEKELKDNVQEEKIINQEEAQENEQENEFEPVKLTNLAKERAKELASFHRGLKKLAFAIQGGYSKEIIEKAKADTDRVYEELLKKDDAVKAYVGQSFDKVGETVSYVLQGIDYTKSAVSKSPKILDNTAGLFWDVRSWNWVPAQKGIEITAGTLDALTTFIGLLGGVLALSESYSSTADMDLAEQTVGLTLGTLGLGVGIWGAVEMANIAKDTAEMFMHSIKMPSTAAFASEAVSQVGFALAVTGFGLATFQGAVAYKHHKDLKSAKAYFEKRDKEALKEAKESGDVEKERKAKKEARFNKNIAKLSQVAIEEKRDSAIFASVLGAIGVATAAMPLLAPLATGAMAVTAVVGLIQKGIKVKKSLDADKQAFDDYFNVEKIYEEVMKNDPRFNKVKAGGSSKVAEKRKEAIKMNIRRQLAAAYGFSNIWDARIYIANQYAEYIRGKLYPPGMGERNLTAEEKSDLDAMKTFIKSLGLAVDRQEGKPTVNQIRCKLSGGK